MGQLDRTIDPVAADYVSAPGGAFAEGDVLDNKVAMSLGIPLGSWEGDPLLGNRLFELEREVDSVDTRRKVDDYVRQSLAWLIDSGEIVELDVLVESGDVPGRVVYEVDYLPAHGDKRRTLGPFFVAVGAV